MRLMLDLLDYTLSFITAASGQGKVTCRICYGIDVFRSCFGGGAPGLCGNICRQGGTD